jgi:LSD1 subclass zinc finger protein
MNSDGPLVETRHMWCEWCGREIRHSLNYAMGGDSPLESWRCALCHTTTLTKDGERVNA